jgi:hypothetical protein
MSHTDVTQPHRHDARPCVSCGTAIPPGEPILVKFRRCYYCGRHNPLGASWKTRAAPAVLLAAAGLVAIFWTHLAS